MNTLFIYFSLFVYICANSDVNVHNVKLFRIKLELELELELASADNLTVLLLADILYPQTISQYESIGE